MAKFKILDEITKRGIKILPDVLDEILKNLESEIQEKNTELDGMTFPSIVRPNSSEDCFLYFSGKKGVTLRSKSMNSTVLEGLTRLGHNEAILISRLRSIIRSRSTVKKLYNEVLSSGRIYPKFESEAITGRIYPSDPNINGLPMDIRKAIIPDEGNVFINFDYKSEELCICASVTGEKKIFDILESGADLFNELSIDQNISRKAAKAVVYGKFYGQTPSGLSMKIGCSELEASTIQQRLYDFMPKISDYLFDLGINARKRGYTETLGGRVYEVNFDSANFEEEIRRAVNFVVQGTGSDIMDCLLADHGEISEFLKSEGARVVVSVYDALLIECSKEKVERIKDVVTKVMIDIPKKFGVKLLLSSKIGNSWYEVCN